MDVADKRVLAPVYITEFSTTDTVPDHQFAYFAQLSGSNTELVRRDLFVFGQLLKDTIQHHAITWAGFGILEAGDKQISFSPQEIRLDSLQSVAAHKVMRQHGSHRVRVGDQEMSLSEANEIFYAAPRRRRTYFNLAGWILFAIALILILFYLYKNSFNPLSSGLKKRVDISTEQTSGPLAGVY